MHREGAIFDQRLGRMDLSDSHLLKMRKILTKTRRE